MLPEACQAFSNRKNELVNASIQSIDETLLFVVECDTSDVAISATLNQGGRPVAFLSPMQHRGEVFVSCRRKGSNSNYRSHEKMERSPP